MKTQRNKFNATCMGIAFLVMLLMSGCGQATTTGAGPGQESTDHSLTDMAGRHVALPDQVSRVSALHPIPSYLLWRLAPNKLASKDMVFVTQYLSEDSTKLLDEKDIAMLKGLPTTGVFFKGLDPEQLLKVKPDTVITMTKDPQIEQLSEKIKIPIVAVSKDTLNDYAQAILLIGKLVDNEAEAQKLEDYWNKTIAEVVGESKLIPDSQRQRVYYVNTDLLTTPGKDTVMNSIIELAGGKSLAGSLSGNSTDENLPVSLEQLLAWNPQVIIVKSLAQKEKVLNSPEWKSIDAVKAGHVVVQPRYAVMDGMMAIMGLKWANGVLYHQNDQEFEKQFHQKLAEFYSLFYHYNLTAEQMADVPK